MRPLVCASLTQATVDGQLAAAGETEADLVEARLDCIAHVDADAVRALATGLPLPAIATLRPVAEGGHYKGDEAERGRLLTLAMDAGFHLVDVERDAAFRAQLLEHARATGGRVLVSHHDWEATPDADVLLHLAREARAGGAWGAKAATRVTGARDAASLVEAAQRAAREGLRLAVMGVDDPVLRLVAPALRQPLVYARPEAAAAAAPGQAPAALTRAIHDLFPEGTVDAGTRPVAILGHPARHSLSPRMQTVAFQAAGVNAVYLAADVTAERLGAAVDGLRALGFLGANVTTPHKRAVLDHADHVAPSAAKVAAGNTLVIDEGEVTAHNTDGEGALRALREAGCAVDGATCLLLGAGGAARAVAHALRDAGARVTVANRTLDRAEALAGAVDGRAIALDRAPEAAATADVVLNCTKLGMGGEGTPLPAGAIREGHVVFDAVYHTGGTPLIRAARAAGAKAVPGEAMLLHQGTACFELWTGREAPVGAMRRALEDALEVSAWRRAER